MRFSTATDLTGQFTTPHAEYFFFFISFFACFLYQEKKHRRQQTVSISKGTGHDDEGVIILHDCAQIIFSRVNRDNCGVFINEDEMADCSRVWTNKCLS